MRSVVTIGLAIACAAGASSSLFARDVSDQTAVVANTPTFAIVDADGRPLTGIMRRLAKRASAELQEKGYRQVSRGRSADLVVRLGYQGKVVAYRGQDQGFIWQPSRPIAGIETLPYPSGELHPYMRGQDRAPRVMPRTIEMHLAVSVVGADRQNPVFADQVYSRVPVAEIEKTSVQLVEHVLDGMPAAKG